MLRTSIAIARIVAGAAIFAEGREGKNEQMQRCSYSKELQHLKACKIPKGEFISVTGVRLYDSEEYFIQVHSRALPRGSGIRFGIG
jgi:hypothetical protein